MICTAGEVPGVGSLDNTFQRMHRDLLMTSALIQISCLDVFKDGSLLAMGTCTTIGVPADIYVWDLDQRKLQQHYHFIR